MGDNVRRALLTGERVLWEGRPYGGLIFRPIEIVLIPFSLIWGGFAITWNIGVWVMDRNVSDVSFKLFGLPFMAVGLYVIFGRFLLDKRLRRDMRYAVTDRRILIFRSDKASTFRSVDIKRLPALEMDERPDGTGTIRFGAAAGWFGGGNFGIWQPTLDGTPQFMRIPDVRRVFELIHEQAGA